MEQGVSVPAFGTSPICSEKFHGQSLLLFLILGYMMAGLLFVAWPIHSFLKDFIIAPLYFLLPMGVGLLFITSCGPSLRSGRFMSTSQILTTAVFFGFVFITLFYQELERWDLLIDYFSYTYPLLFILSLAGFYRGRQLIGGVPLRPHLITVALLSPLLLVFYYFYFIKFTSFPLRDIFQEVHFMKGALELSKFHVLNPFTADSYIPVQQVHLALLHHWYGYDLLHSQWLLPIYNGLFRLACLYCLFRILLQDQWHIRIALGFLVVTLQNLFSPTNGDLLFSLTLVMLAVIINCERCSTVRLSHAGVVVVGISTLLILGYHTANVQDLGMYLFPTAFLVLIILRFNMSVFWKPAWLGMLSLLALALHPAQALLYVPSILLAYTCYVIILSSHQSDNDSLRRKAVVFAIGTTIAVLCLLLYKSYRLLSLQNPDTLQRLAEWFLGRQIDSNESYPGTLIEWGRLAPPALHVLFILIAVPHLTMLVLRILKCSATDQACLTRDDTLLLFTWTTASVLLLLDFSGVPYFHRGLYYPLVFGCCLMAVLLHRDLRDYLTTGDRRVALKYGLWMLLYTILAAKYLYHATYMGGNVSDPYLEAYAPWPTASAILLATLLIAMVVPSQRYLVATFMVASIGVGLGADKTYIKTKFYRYSYGDDWPEPHVLSHYTLNELRVAEGLKNLSPGTVLLSDPYTTGILSGLTGLNGLYTFANLGVMQDEYKKAISAFFIAFLGEHRESFVRKEHVLAWLKDFITRYPGAVPEARYAYERLGRSLDVKTVEQNLVIVLNAERTWWWAKGTDSYFPQRGRFSDAFIDLHIKPFFNILQNVENTVIVLTLPL